MRRYANLYDAGFILEHADWVREDADHFGKMPLHGIARIVEWEVAGTEVRPDGAVELRLVLGPDDASRALGYDAFRIGFRVAMGATLARPAVPGTGLSEMRSKPFRVAVSWAPKTTAQAEETPAILSSTAL